MDNKQWHFDAANTEERDDWVTAIEQQILNSLQSNETAKAKNNPVEPSVIQSIKMKVPGNSFCVDCDATSKNIIHKFREVFSFVLFQILIGLV